ncbi:hypothetical protein FRC12_020951 [Ceratobasidium sp. 428]|nr:hypothetical protein FRC12_020951 [Ceratobasidium sp. 428]
MFHERSGTLIGGKDGIVWAVRAIIKILANILAVLDNGGVEFAVPAPFGYETRRLGSAQLALAKDWAHALNDAIKKSTAVLSESWAERCRPADTDADVHGDIPFDHASPSIPPNNSRSKRQPHASGSCSRVSSIKPAGVTTHNSDNSDDAEMIELGDDATSEEEMDESDKKGKGVRKSKGKGKNLPKPAATVEQASKSSNAGQERGAGEGEGEGWAEADTGADQMMPDLSDLPDVPEVPIPKNPVEYPTPAPSLSAEAEAYLAQNQRIEASWKRERLQADGDYHRLIRTDFEKMWNAPAPIPDPPLPSREDCRAKFRQDMSKWGEGRDWMFDTPIRCRSVPPCTAPPDQFQQALEAYVEALEQPMNDWAAEGKDWVDQFSPQMIKDAMDKARLVPTSYPRLVYALALHSELVAECRERYDVCMRKYLQAMYLKLGEGTALLRRAKVLQAAGEFPKLPSGLIQQVYRLVWTIRLMFTEYAEREALALSHRNMMRDAYNYVQAGLRLSELVGLGGILEEWTEKATELYRAQDTRALERWVAAGCGGSLRPQPSRFPWGNPAPVSFDKHAKADLVRAREALAKRAAEAKGDNESTSDATTPRPRMRPQPKQPPSTDDESIPGATGNAVADEGEDVGGATEAMEVDPGNENQSPNLNRSQSWSPNPNPNPMRLVSRNRKQIA